MPIVPKKILLAGGGTGGHVYPALAMGDALRARGHSVLYYGDPDRLEGRVASQRGYEFRSVQGPQYPRAGIIGKFRFAAALLNAILITRRKIQQDRPDMVLGVGGYIMAPTVLAAWTLGIPSAIHEANVSPGLANRLCARVARLVLLTFDESRKHLKTSAVVKTVGCPVNPKILQGNRHEAAARYGLDPARPTVLVVGGSLGAATLNDVALAIANDPSRHYQLLHITGPRYHQEVLARYGNLPQGVVVLPYEDRMSEAFAISDLVVARAGSSTLAELCATQKPSLLIPSPNVTDNHQEGNARGLERAGAAVVAVEKGLEPKTVAQQIAHLLNPETLHKMSAAAGQLARLDVAEQVALLLETLES